MVAVLTAQDFEGVLTGPAPVAPAFVAEKHTVPDRPPLPRDEVVFQAQESVEGIIAEETRGPHGFGYDPLFFYPPLSGTFGEARPEDKDQVSHRGKAFARLRRFLESGAAAAAGSGA